MADITIQQHCGGCEKWAQGIGSNGDETRGRCTNPYSVNHDFVMGYDDACPHWIPMDFVPAKLH